MDFCPNCLFEFDEMDTCIRVACKCGCGKEYLLHAKCANNPWNGFGMYSVPTTPFIINKIVNPIGMSKQFCEA